MLVSDVCPVAILKAVFCIICNLFICVCEIMGDHIVQAYSRRGRVSALYVCMSVSFCFPQLVEVSALIMFSDFFAFIIVFCMCGPYVCLGSKVNPKILGCIMVGKIMLFIDRCSIVLYCAGSGVNRVVVVLSALSVRLFLMVQS